MGKVRGHGPYCGLHQVVECKTGLGQDCLKRIEYGAVCCAMSPSTLRPPSNWPDTNGRSSSSVARQRQHLSAGPAHQAPVGLHLFRCLLIPRKALGERSTVVVLGGNIRGKRHFSPAPRPPAPSPARFECRTALAGTPGKIRISASKANTGAIRREGAQPRRLSRAAPRSPSAASTRRLNCDIHLVRVHRRLVQAFHPQVTATACPHRASKNSSRHR